MNRNHIPPTMKLNGAEILRTLLERQGVHTISGIPGGAILPFYDALHGSTIRHVLARHEQGAGFIAQGLARVTGKAAVCVGTSGPGATNLITAIADAHLDSIPLVAITGQVPQALIGSDAFQEVDTYGLTLPITKHNFLVRDITELLEVVPLAFEMAESGRPGPVAIDVPKDVLLAEMEIKSWPEPGKRRPAASCEEDQIAELAGRIEAAQRPLLYLGGGVIHANATGLVRELARHIDAPSVSTLMALGSMSADDPTFLGMLGMHGTKATTHALEETDLLIAIGARFDDRATGKVAEFCPQASIAHIDIDRAEIGKIKTPFLGIVGDAADVLERLLERLPKMKRPAWRERTINLKRQFPLDVPDRGSDPLHPTNLCRFLGEQLPRDAVITTDVGQHQMWMAQAYPFREPRTLLTSGGLGTMGFGLPTAIGAALAAPDKRVACVSGDGSILMNIQELATLAEWELSVAVVVFNNANLGMVRQQQELFYGRRYSASRFDCMPDFAGIARSFGIPGIQVEPNRDPLGTIADALERPGPCLIDVPVNINTGVYPIVPPGAANRNTIGESAPILA